LKRERESKLAEKKKNNIKRHSKRTTAQEHTCI